MVTNLAQLHHSRCDGQHTEVEFGNSVMSALSPLLRIGRSTKIVAKELSNYVSEIDVSRADHRANPPAFSSQRPMGMSGAEGEADLVRARC
jgi:hypothetical protein